VAHQDENPTQVISVVVVDDHEMFADSVARALERPEGIEVVAIARSCSEGVAMARMHTPNVAIVDYQLPDGDGVALGTRIREVSPDTKILLLTGLVDKRIMAAALDAGYAGFLTKDQGVDELVLAIRCVHAGEAHIPAAMLAELLPRLREVAAERERELSRLAELERFQHLTVGRELKMIELKQEIAALNARIYATERGS
jgi:DNA-binding NarL/FixJ family response regulator